MKIGNVINKNFDIPVNFRSVKDILLCQMAIVK